LAAADGAAGLLKKLGCEVSVTEKNTSIALEAAAETLRKQLPLNWQATIAPMIEGRDLVVISRGCATPIRLSGQNSWD